MSNDVIQIKRYPNRRLYARHESRYISLQEIEELIRKGHTVEIRDSQSGEDLTGQVLAQIIMERHPDKMSLFPTDMLHSILRSNDVMAEFLRDYFQQSLTYLDYLQRHGNTVAQMTRPTHWIKAWLDGHGADRDSSEDDAATKSNATDGNGESAPAQDPVHEKIEQLEARIRQLEAGNSD